MVHEAALSVNEKHYRETAQTVLYGIMPQG